MAYSSSVEIAVTDLARAGIDLTPLPTTPTATHGNKFRWTQTAFLLVNNGSGGDITVTFDVPRAVDGQDVADLVVTVPAGQLFAIGPFTETFLQVDGFIWAVFSAVATITIKAMRLP